MSFRVSSPQLDARGVKSAFAYDGLNRVSTVTFTGESGYQTPQITYTYDETESNFYVIAHSTAIRELASN